MSRTTHGESKTKLYNVWRGMLSRCFYKKGLNYHRYGGRGIIVCDEWLRYEDFRDWALVNGYGAGLHLDRINNDGNYSPENCRFVKPVENSNNRQNTVFVLVEGKRLPISKLIADLKVSRSVVLHRHERHKMNGDEIVANIRATKRQNRNHPIIREKPAGLRGIYRHFNKWGAICRKGDICIHSSGHISPKDAALAYDKLARKLHGEKAKLNFPDYKLFDDADGG